MHFPFAGRVATACLLVAFSAGVSQAQNPGAGATEVTFPTSAGAEAQRTFLTGLAWLHSFEYEQALESFQRAQTIEPGFAMAYWGEAICYQQFLWGNENPALARDILARYAVTPAARAARTSSARERAWLASLDVLFGPGDRPARLSAFAEAMRQIAVANTDDAEAALFHALALMSTSSRGLAGAHHAGAQELPLLVGSEVQQRVAAILNGVLKEHPRHPGALHYLIHAYDDPAHAAMALNAARAYATVVPESSHARHMPAHVFMQLGRWSEAAASDEAAVAASEAMVKRKGLRDTMTDYHALSWLVYEYLQLGRFGDARTTLGRLSTVADDSKLPALLSLRASLRARVVAESGMWSELTGPDYVNFDELFAVGLSAVKRGNPGLAEMARQRLEAMGVSDRYRDRRPLLEVMSRVLSGQLRLAAGDADGALAILREAADIERALPASIGPPPLVKPAQELFAEMLLDRRQARDADAQFAASLERAPNRSASLLGRARAAALAGDAVAARRYYSQLLDNWRQADTDRPELAEARTFISSQEQAAPSAASRFWPLLPVGLGLFAVVVLTRRRRSRGR